MKRIISLAAIVMVLSFSSMLFAQVEIKPTSTSKTSDIKTGTNATDTKTDQKVNLGGGYTKSGQQINPPASSQEKGKDPAGTVEPGTIKSLPPASGSIIYDRMGEVYATVGPNGKITDTRGALIGQYTAKGEYLGPDGQLLGTIKDGVIRTKEGKEIGRVSKDGKVTNAKGKFLGTIYDDGTIRNSKGSRLGSAPGVDRNIAVMVFFNTKKQTGERKQNTNNRTTFKSRPVETK